MPSHDESVAKSGLHEHWWISTPLDGRTGFGLLVNAAIVEGRLPCHVDRLLPRAAAAVARVAQQHPCATAEDIVTAYEVFDLEVRDAARASAPPTPPWSGLANHR